MGELNRGTERLHSLTRLVYRGGGGKGPGRQHAESRGRNFSRTRTHRARTSALSAMGDSCAGSLSKSRAVTIVVVVTPGVVLSSSHKNWI